MNKLVAFGFLVSLIVVFTQAALLVVEEGTPNGVDWRQLRVELPPGTFDQDGNLNFLKPIWTRVEGTQTLPFAVLGSLYCDETVNMSVAALIDGTWVCVDINSPLLPPSNNSVRSARQLPDMTRVNPPASCSVNESPLLYSHSAHSWICANPDLSLIQYVNARPRPVCNDTDLVVFNEQEQWFECKALNKIQFKSTITKTDYRWQVPVTTRHIGSIASTGRVRSGGYSNFRWSAYAFTASSDQIAYDQTTPPQVVTSGGANWLAYTLTTSFVGITGSSPYYKTLFFPIYPGTPASYNANITKYATGTNIRGSTLTFSPGVVTFAPSGTNTVTYVTATGFKYNTGSAGPTGGLVVVPLTNVTVDSGSYPVVEIAETVSDWYVGTTPDYNPNLLLTIAMWLQYVQPSGF